LLGRKAGKLADSPGAPFLFGLASSLLTFGFLLLSTFAGAPPAAVSLFLVFGNVGQMFMQIALTKTVSAAHAGLFLLYRSRFGTRSDPDRVRPQAAAPAPGSQDRR